MKAADFFSVAKQSFQEWAEDRATHEAAALAYYALLSVPAMLLLIQWMLGQVVSDQVQEQVLGFVTRAVRGEGGRAISALIENADRPGGAGSIAGLISLVTLAISATTVVTHLEQALNRIWEIAEEDKGIVDKIRERLSSLLIVALLGLFLLLSVSASAAVSAFAGTLLGNLPFGEWGLQLVNIVFSLALLTVLFGATMRIIPNAIVAWEDVWLGAGLTAVLFVIGQYALSYYLGKSAPGSAYGVAGSVVAFVVWVYYSALILFLGAEFTQVYANRFGSHIRPDEASISLQEKMLREQAEPWQEPAADAEDGRRTRQGQERARPAAQSNGRQESEAARERRASRGEPSPAGKQKVDEAALPYRVAAAAAVAVVAVRALLRRD